MPTRKATRYHVNIVILVVGIVLIRINLHLVCYFYLNLSFFFLQILDAWSPKLSHENDGLIFNPAEEVQTITPQLIRLRAFSLFLQI